MPDASDTQSTQSQIDRASESALSLRFGTIRQMGRILKAEGLIRFRPMSRWRESLGKVSTQDLAQGYPADSASEETLREASRHVRRTERAIRRLPYHPKCLPQAMALHWSLKSAGIPSRLIIAMQRELKAEQDSSSALALNGEDRYHAWVELGDAMLIGQCDRKSYRPVLGFELPAGQGREQSATSG